MRLAIVFQDPCEIVPTGQAEFLSFWFKDRDTKLHIINYGFSKEKFEKDSKSMKKKILRLDSPDCSYNDAVSLVTIL